MRFTRGAALTINPITGSGRLLFTCLRKSADSVRNIRCRRPFIEEGVDFPPVVAVKKVGREGVKVMEWIVRKKKEFWGTGEVMVLGESEV
ncbi:hypothetical protein V1478_004495 [Vespula squamosa]|uniref:Uncharacterized protein n=1 Tax=Vespula squamosa TaxID=30214 RepID=A0ABD2BGC7_VESSQ